MLRIFGFVGLLENLASAKLLEVLGILAFSGFVKSLFF
jgi:hypothetical protein